MAFSVTTLNVRGFNKISKRRQIFRWLHQQKPDVIFLQETYSSAENIKIWENEWVGKTFFSHGSTHGRGVMILFKPKIDVKIENSITDKNGRFLVEPIFDETKYIFFLNVYAPNEQAQQTQFLRDLSNNVINHYANEKVILGGDFNCALLDFDKRGGRSIAHKKGVITEFNSLLNIHDLVDLWRQKTCRYTWFHVE